MTLREQIAKDARAMMALRQGVPMNPDIVYLQAAVNRLIDAHDKLEWDVSETVTDASQLKPVEPAKRKPGRPKKDA